MRFKQVCDATDQQNGLRAQDTAAQDEPHAESRLVAAYLNEMGAIPALSREEEHDLAVSLDEARIAFAELVTELPQPWRGHVLEGDESGPEVGRKWPLERLEACYRRLLDEAAESDDPALCTLVDMAGRLNRIICRARDGLVLGNLRFVVHVVSSNGFHSIPFLDLVQEGNLGLIKALDNYEPERGLRFSTYAYHWIRQAISKAIVYKFRFIRVPGHVRQNFRKLMQASRELRHELGRAPTPLELATRLGYPREKVETLIAASWEPYSLENTETDSGTGILTHLPDPTVPCSEESALHRDLRQKILASIDRVLTERENRIIRLRFGLDEETPHTLKEVAGIYGVSRERVRQIEQAALAKLHASRHRLPERRRATNE